MTTSLSAEDVQQLHDVVALYAHAIDRRAFHELSKVFTYDVVFDASDFGRQPCSGLAAVIELMTTEQNHPLAHHSTNVILEPQQDGSVHVLSKGLAVLVDGSVQSLTYHDIAVPTSIGWRLRIRTCRKKFDRKATI